jgi:hypothetical protein
VVVLALDPAHTGGAVSADRYEPLPSLPELPGWLWRKTGRGLRIGLAVVVLAIAGATIAAIPQLSESKQERAEAARRERAAHLERQARALAAEQRPRFGRSAAVAPVGAEEAERLAAREQMLDDLAASVLVDARKRVREGDLKGPVRRVECEPFPRTVDGVGAEADLSQRRGGYACVAITAQFERSEESIGGVIGHPYRARIDFRTGRYGFCKISGVPGPEREFLVTVPPECGGRDA